LGAQWHIMSILWTFGHVMKEVKWSFEH
jgi:hypothetical protein